MTHSLFKAAALEAEEAVLVAASVSAYAALADGAGEAPLANGLAQARASSRS